MTELHLLLTVRALHILASMIWAGGAILIAAFIMPSIKAAGPAGAPVMRELTVVRRLPEVLAATAIVAIISGGYLYWIASDGFRPAWLSSSIGATYTCGAVASLLAAVIGLGINIPTANRMGALAVTLRAAGTPPTPEQSAVLGTLASRVTQGTRAVAILLAISAIAMAVARYLH